MNLELMDRIAKHFEMEGLFGDPMKMFVVIREDKGESSLEGDRFLSKVRSLLVQSQEMDFEELEELENTIKIDCKDSVLKMMLIQLFSEIPQVGSDKDIYLYNEDEDEFPFPFEVDDDDDAESFVEIVRGYNSLLKYLRVITKSES